MYQWKFLFDLDIALINQSTCEIWPRTRTIIRFATCLSYLSGPLLQAAAENACDTSWLLSFSFILFFFSLFVERLVSGSIIDLDRHHRPRRLRSADYVLASPFVQIIASFCPRLYSTPHAFASFSSATSIKQKLSCHTVLLSASICPRFHARSFHLAMGC